VEPNAMCMNDCYQLIKHFSSAESEDAEIEDVTEQYSDCRVECFKQELAEVEEYQRLRGEWQGDTE